MSIEFSDSLDSVNKRKISLLETIREDAKRDAELINEHVDSTDSCYQYYQYMINSILQVFDEGVEKLKFALVLPYLLEDQCELEYHLSKEAHKLVNAYCEKSLIMKIVEKSEMDNLNTGIHTINLDYQILEAVEIIQNNPQLSANLHKYLKKVSTIGERILDVIKIVQQVAATRLWVAVLSTKGSENIPAPKVAITSKNAKFQSQLSALQDTEESVKRQIQIKTDLINQYQYDLINQKKLLTVKKNKAAINARAQIEDMCNKNEIARLKLEDEIAEIKLDYANYQNSNIQTDKKLRDRKKRFLIQLQAWIKKYEDDVSAKVVEHYKIEEKIQEEQKALDLFMIKFNIQEKDYLHIWTRKQAEKELALRRRIKKYEVHRAARTIQRYFREFLDKKKKKGRKGK